MKRKAYSPGYINTLKKKAKHIKQIKGKKILDELL